MQALTPGSLLQGGMYKIEKVLGLGNFGITYQATLVSLNRKVAIKEFFLKSDCERKENSTSHTVLSRDKEQIVERLRQEFIKEARIIAAIENPHVVSVNNVFEENNTAYMVMKYIDGTSLKDLVANGPMSESKALGYINQIGEALSAIHSCNYLHLDVKPANILVNDKNVAILVDFGASKHYHARELGTTTGLVGITPGYAPIELYSQTAEVENIKLFSPATDVYSLAATLYTLLTGKRPAEATLLPVLGLGEKPANVSKPVWNAIKRAMSLQQDKRPQSVEEFIIELCTSVMEREQDATTTVAIEPSTAPHDNNPIQQPKPAPVPTPQAVQRPTQAHNPQPSQRVAQQPKPRSYQPSSRGAQQRKPVRKESNNNVIIVLLAVLFAVLICGGLMLYVGFRNHVEKETNIIADDSTQFLDEDSQNAKAYLSNNPTWSSQELENNPATAGLYDALNQYDVDKALDILSQFRGDANVDAIVFHLRRCKDNGWIEDAKKKFPYATDGLMSVQNYCNWVDHQCIDSGSGSFPETQSAPKVEKKKEITSTATPKVEKKKEITTTTTIPKVEKKKEKTSTPTPKVEKKKETTVTVTPKVEPKKETTVTVTPKVEPKTPNETTSGWVPGKKTRNNQE